MISETVNITPNFSKSKKATPPSGKKKVTFNQRPIAPKISSPKELPAGAAATVISIEDQNLLSQVEFDAENGIDEDNVATIQAGDYTNRLKNPLNEVSYLTRFFCQTFVENQISFLAE